MKILFIAPLPPPITGHSIVSKELLDHLALDNRVEVVDLSKNSSMEGVDGAKRIAEVGGIIFDVWKKKRRADMIYLTISESLAGNLKDLCIYVACLGYLSKTYIHLHGGSIKRQLWDRHGALYSANRLFIRRLAGVVISGQSHRPIFEGLIDASRIHIVPNFAQDYLFIDEQQISAKFSCTQPLRILYMSSMRPKKGYADLIEAFCQLSDKVKKRLRIDFAGRFDSPSREARFREQIAGVAQIHYHGVVDDQTKQTLFAQSHVFCLPTEYFEGQPISILEAYASGCVVLTTGQSGIRDVFRDGTNGFEVEAGSVQSIGTALEALVSRREQLLPIALTNRLAAGSTYRSARYIAALRSIVEARCPERTMSSTT